MSQPFSRDPESIHQKISLLPRLNYFIKFHQISHSITSTDSRLSHVHHNTAQKGIDGLAAFRNNLALYALWNFRWRIFSACCLFARMVSLPQWEQQRFLLDDFSRLKCVTPHASHADAEPALRRNCLVTLDLFLTVLTPRLQIQVLWRKQICSSGNLKLFW